MGLLIRNYTDQSQTFTVGFNFAAGEIVQEPAKKVTVAQKSTAEVRWKVRINQENEAAEVQFWADGSDELHSDNVIVTIPVLAYGVKQKESQPHNSAGTTNLVIPEDTQIDKSQARITLSSSILSGLQENLSYLINYPYGCVEQLSSALSALLTVKENPQYFEGIKDSDKVDEYIQAGVDQLFKLQQADGGWAYWSTREKRSVPFYTLYATEQLLRAEAAGAKLPADWQRQVALSLQDRLGISQKNSEKKFDMSGKLTNGQTMSLYALMLLDFDNYINSFNWQNIDFSSVSDTESLNYALRLAMMINDQTLIPSLEQKLISNATSNNDNLLWRASLSERYQSQDSNTALSLRTLMMTPNFTEYRPKVEATINYLWRQRQRKYWSNTYGTARMTETLFAYAQMTESQTPINYTITVAGKTIKQGTLSNSKDIATIDLPLADLAASNEITVTSNHPDEALYWALSTEWWRTSKNLPAVTNEEYKMAKVYHSLKGNAGTPQTGDIVTVYLDLYNEKTYDLYNVVVTDYLPSGFMALNSDLDNYLKFTPIGREENPYYANMTFYPDKVEAALYKLKPGHNVVSYQARVVAAADSVLLPATSELMYQPEITLQDASRQKIELVSTAPSWAKGYEHDLIAPNPVTEKEKTDWQWETWAMLLVLILAILSVYKLRKSTKVTKQNKESDDAENK
jgi:uncharacterized protein YfaS (alpha-2-macroglobulin family)